MSVPSPLLDIPNHLRRGLTRNKTMGKTAEKDHIISGVIINRRSIGRNLAFADVLITPSFYKACSSSDVKTTIKVKFQRQTFLGQDASSCTIDSNDGSILNCYEDLDDPFPIKKSSLPFGAHVIMQLGNCTQTQHVDQNRTSSFIFIWEVVSWKIIDHPKEMAEQLASLSITGLSPKEVTQSTIQEDVVVGNKALSCSTYLKVRREQFEKIQNIRVQLSGSTQVSKSHKARELDTRLADEFLHGGKHAKVKRAKVFAAWLYETYFGTSNEKICQPCNSKSIICSGYGRKDHVSWQKVHVLDIAGGKGHLSLELILQQLSSDHNTTKGRSNAYITKCTIVDPVVRKGSAKMRHSKLQKAKGKLESSIPIITHLATEFTKDSFQYIQKGLDEDFSTKFLLLGLHPDQCTEDIVDAALHSNTSFAIIPCCVYPDLFFDRQYCNENKVFPVRAYEDFLKYLMQKDEEIQMTTLPFEGKNVVLYKIARS